MNVCVVSTSSVICPEGGSLTRRGPVLVFKLRAGPASRKKNSLRRAASASTLPDQPSASSAQGKDDTVAARNEGQRDGGMANSRRPWASFRPRRLDGWVPIGPGAAVPQRNSKVHAGNILPIRCSFQATHPAHAPRIGQIPHSPPLQPIVVGHSRFRHIPGHAAAN